MLMPSIRGIAMSVRTEIRLSLERRAQAGHAVFGQRHGRPGVFKYEGKQLPRIAVVIDNQHLAMCGHRVRGKCGRAARNEHDRVSAG